MHTQSDLFPSLFLMSSAEYSVPVPLNPQIDILTAVPAVRRQFMAGPTNGSEFLPQSTIEIPLPTGAASTFIDPSRSFLKFDFYNIATGFTPQDFSKYVASSPPGLNVAVCQPMIYADPSIGFASVIEELRTFGSGLPLEEMTNYSNIFTTVVETEFGDALNNGLMLQACGAGGCYRPNFGSSSFSGEQPLFRNGAFNQVTHLGNLNPDTAATLYRATGTGKACFDTHTNTSFQELLSGDHVIGDCYIKMMNPTATDLADDGAIGLTNSSKGGDGYTNYASTFLTDTADTTLSDANYSVLKGIVTLCQSRNRPISGYATATSNKLYDDSIRINGVLANNYMSIHQPSVLPYWHAVMANSSVDTVFPTQCFYPSGGSYLSPNIASSGVTGGLTSTPFWERTVAVPTKAMADSLNASSTVVGNSITNASTFATTVAEYHEDVAVTNYTTVCIPLLSGFVGINATKYLPSMLLASQSFMIQLKLGDYLGAIGNPLNTNPVVLYGESQADANELVYSSLGSTVPGIDPSIVSGGDDAWISHCGDGPFYSQGRVLDNSVKNSKSSMIMKTLGKEMMDDTKFTASTSWSLKNVAMVMEEIIVTPELTNELFSQASRQPIRWTSQTFRDYQYIFTASYQTQNFSIVLPSNLQSVIRLFHTFRIYDALSHAFYRRNYRYNPAITSWQYKIGTALLPSSPLINKALPDYYNHQLFGCKSSLSALSLLTSLHKTTGQNTNFVQGFADHSAWNASLESQQCLMRPVCLASDTATVAESRHVSFPVTSTYCKDATKNFIPDFSSASLLGSFMLAYDFCVFGGEEGTSRNGYSFQSDTVYLDFTLDKSKKCIRSDEFYRQSHITTSGHKLEDDSGTAADEIIGNNQSTYPIVKTYQDTSIMMNTIAKHDMVITIQPEGTVQIAY